MNKLQTGDLILFQIEKCIWTAVIHPILAQKLYADDYNSIKQKALEYAAYWAKRYRIITVWKEIDANTNKYFKVL